MPCRCSSCVAIWGAGRQIVIEKPFGVDLDTSNALARELSACLAEPEMYRIDHYLGKEMVQNLFALRWVRYSSGPLQPINQCLPCCSTRARGSTMRHFTLVALNEVGACRIDHGSRDT